MCFVYSAFGLNIGCEVALPALRPRGNLDPSAERFDLRIFPQATPSFAAHHSDWTLVARSAHLDEAGRPLVEVERWRNRYHFRYHDGCRFWFDAESGEAWMRWPAASSMEAALLYFLGPVMTLILRRAGRVVLHAAAVSITGGVLAAAEERAEGGAVLLAGPAGAGKSTTAAALVAAGHRLVSDDTSALAGRGPGMDPQILPDSPRLRLWPEAGAFLPLDVEALPTLCADWEKRAWDLSPERFENRPQKIHAVYLLAPSSSADAIPSFEALSPTQAVPALAAHAAAPELGDRETARRDFDVLADLVRATPIVRLDRGRSTAEDLVSFLLNDLRARLGTSASAIA